MRPITLYIFVHSDVHPTTAHTLGRAHFKVFTDEIQSITGRHFNFKEIRNVPGMTDFNYKTPDEGDALRRWQIAAIAYKNLHGLGWGKTERYILVTQDPINDRVLGCAYLGQPPIIACTKHYQVIGHEVGHSFNATHEDAELGWNAWGGVCETMMYATVSNIRGNCYRFTQKNRKNIKDFLSDAP